VPDACCHRKQILQAGELPAHFDQPQDNSFLADVLPTAEVSGQE